MILTSLALLTLTEAATNKDSANAQDSESYWHTTVSSDKEALSSAVSGMEAVAQDYRRASQNRSHAAALSLNLAEKAFNDAHGDKQQDHQKAVTDFNNALKQLKSVGAKGNWKDAEKTARQKAAQVDKLERQEAEDAKSKLRTDRSSESNKVSHAYQKAKTAANTLLRDRKHLAIAMRQNGKSEHEYESASEQLEHHAERQSESAEHNRDDATDAIEHVFEHAQDRLDDREQQLHDHSTEMREKALDEAVSSLQLQQAAHSSKHQSAQASPVASALNLYAKAEGAHGQQYWKEEEQDAQKIVDSDKTRLSTTMKSFGKLATDVRQSMKNKTRADALAASLAKGSFDEAAANKEDQKKKAVSDFQTYLSELKSASPTGKWGDALKKVEDQARYLDKLDDEENKYASKMLRSKQELQKTEVKGRYHEAHRAAANLLREKNRLEYAMRRAGTKERVYEREEENNERLGERSEGKEENLQGHADDASEQMHEKAGKNLHALQHANNKEQHAASRERHQQIHRAMETLKHAAKGTTSTKKTEKQVENLQKGMPSSSNAAEELLAAPLDFSSSCLLTVGSLGLIIFVYLRRSRPTPVVRPLLG
jgi:hypothetical protein